MSILISALKDVAWVSIGGILSWGITFFQHQKSNHLAEERNRIDIEKLSKEEHKNFIYLFHEFNEFKRKSEKDIKLIFENNHLEYLAELCRNVRKDVLWIVKQEQSLEADLLLNMIEKAIEVLLVTKNEIKDKLKLCIDPNETWELSNPEKVEGMLNQTWLAICHYLAYISDEEFDCLVQT